MRMADIRPGMRLQSTFHPRETITVTELTERGFKYDIPEARSIIPRWGLVMARSGHEHFGLDGEAFYEIAPVVEDAGGLNGEG
jgi:hypothetical protein